MIQTTNIQWITSCYSRTLYWITFDTTFAKFSSSSPSAAVVGGNRAEPRQWVDSPGHTSLQEGCGHSLEQLSKSSDNNPHH